MNDGNRTVTVAALLVVAAIIFAGALYWHDSQGGTPASAANPLPPGAPNPADAYLHQQSGAEDYGGFVQTVGGDRFVIKMENPGNPATGTSPTLSSSTLTVVVDAKTEIYKQGAQKTDAEYQKERDAFHAATLYATDTQDIYLAPDSYEHMPLTLADLKQDTFVIIKPLAAAQGGSITAVSVEVLSQ
jgi:hypothetical protein